MLWLRVLEKRLVKIGIDLHGVLDTKPEFFRKLARFVVAAGGEVHIITGAHLNFNFHKALDAAGIVKDVHYTHTFSIADHHVSMGTFVTHDSHGDPHMPHADWNTTKANYCSRVGIDLHFDDSDIYHHYFTTPYARFYSKDTERQAKLRNFPQRKELL